MESLYVYRNEKRKAQDRRVRKESTDHLNVEKRITSTKRRNKLGVNVTYMDTLLEQMRLDFTKTIEYFKDKERKKLLIITSSFGVMAIIISILIGTADGAFQLLSTETDTSVNSKPYGLFAIIAVFSVALINIVISKYIISLKGECLSSLRQINCLRQGIHSILYFKLHGKYPANNDEMRNGVFGALYEQHKKFDVDNEGLRKKYSSKSIIIRSADFLAVGVLGFLTVSLSSYPFVQALLTGTSFNDLDNIHKLSIFISLGVVCFICYEIFNSATKIKKSLQFEKSNTKQFELELVCVP